MSFRDDRALSILLQLAAEYIAREAGRSTLITPTRAEFGTDRKHVTIYVSVFPDSESEHAVKFLARHADGFRMHMKQHSRLSILPRVTFAADLGEKHRQRLDELSKEIHDLDTPAE